MNRVYRSGALTARETELLRAAAEGLSNRKIGEQYFVSQYTVKNHFTSIFRKLGVTNRKDAIDLIFPLHRPR